MPNTNYFELIFPCPATIIKSSSETQKQKTKVKAKYKRQKRNQNQRIQEAQAAKERLKMFWSKKKEAPAEKKPLLYRENIKTGCTVSGKDEAIRMVGQMLVDSGYVDQPYVEAMLEREKTFPTYMGNGLALPHGVEAAKKEVKASGIAVITLKNPIDWEGNEAQVIIGIAGVGDEHLEILGIIADKMMDEAAAAQLATGDADTVYRLLQ